MQALSEGASPSRENSVRSQGNQTKGSHFHEITGAEKGAKLFGELGDTTNELCHDFHSGVSWG